MQNDQNRILELESSCAAMREALRRDHSAECHLIQGTGICCSCGKWEADRAALSGTAGRSLLERLERAERVAGDVEYWIKQAKISDALYFELRKRLNEACGLHPESGGHADALKLLERLEKVENENKRLMYVGKEALAVLRLAGVGGITRTLVEETFGSTSDLAGDKKGEA